MTAAHSGKLEYKFNSRSVRRRYERLIDRYHTRLLYGENSRPSYVRIDRGTSSGSNTKGLTTVCRIPVRMNRVETYEGTSRAHMLLLGHNSSQGFNATNVQDKKHDVAHNNVVANG